MIVQSTITSSPVEWTIIILVYATSRMKRQRGYMVKLVNPSIWIFQISLPVTIIHVEGINGTLSSLWVNHGKIQDFATRLPLKASTLNLFNRVVHFDGASGFDGYIESVGMYNYYMSIPTGLIAAQMT